MSGTDMITASLRSCAAWRRKLSSNLATSESVCPRRRAAVHEGQEVLGAEPRVRSHDQRAHFDVSVCQVLGLRSSRTERPDEPAPGAPHQGHALDSSVPHQLQGGEQSEDPARL